VNGEGTLCFVNVNELLGFRNGDTRKGKMLQRVVVKGSEGSTKRMAVPVMDGLTPDEREIWLTDPHNRRMHIFDATKMPPAQSRASSCAMSHAGSLQYRWRLVILQRATWGARHAEDRGGLRMKRAPRCKVRRCGIDFGVGSPVRAGDQFGLGTEVGTRMHADK